MSTILENSNRPSFKQILPDLIILPSVALLLSFIMSWATGGFSADFLHRWARGFVTTLVVLPIVLISLGILEKKLIPITGKLPPFVQKLLIAALAACAIETVISFVVTAVSYSFDSSFTGNWWLAFTRSLPVGFAIGLFMSFYMKPRMDKMRAKARGVA